MTGEERDLPISLLAKAVDLSGEFAWSTSDVLVVVDFLARKQAAITGIELWQRVAAHPKWIATSNNECESVGDWAVYVACCANNATSFITRFADYPDALFNLTWWNKDTESDAAVG